MPKGVAGWKICEGNGRYVLGEEAVALTDQHIAGYGACSIEGENVGMRREPNTGGAMGHTPERVLKNPQ